MATRRPGLALGVSARQHFQSGQGSYSQASRRESTCHSPTSLLSNAVVVIAVRSRSRGEETTLKAEKPKIFRIAKYPPPIGSRVNVWFDMKGRQLLVEDETGRVTYERDRPDFVNARGDGAYRRRPGDKALARCGSGRPAARSSGTIGRSSAPAR